MDISMISMELEGEGGVK